MVSFLIDAALAVLLVTATVYLVVVNKRLKMLRTGQSEINALVTTFSKSIDDTDASMKRLVASATEIATRLADELDRAKDVKEDMTLILGSCERTATRMEESVQHARALLRRLDEGAMRPARPRPATAPAAAPAVAPVEERRLVASLDEPENVPAAPEGGEFRPLDLPQRPGAQDLAPDAAPAPTSMAAPAAAQAVPAAPTPTEAAPQVEPQRQMAVGAFYARLRTVGSEG
ncbi:DUF6468 domain-containing protein [Azospirillum agricola]|uniref:DUF6468 domain-containing protein n=1 Tax=Azospirillum agricola TaxID=1720247 RepID=UPI000A0EFD50|nr:DUF6468 domain-containing protein [Azospirillum agricola]SMH62955.1 hypothetical protein SAMN02982994_6781 [Azospirillum lipoferum]